MIQRKQTIWLLIAAILNAGLFYFDLYRADMVTNGITITDHLRINDHYPSLLVAIIITVLPLLAMFMYKARSRQKSLVLFSMVATIGFVSLVLMRVSNYNNGTSAPVSGTYWIGSVLPILSLIFLIMALGAILTAEKLIKSLDRLR
jgi:heme/copper-type cytochrome/quinol oxidase subunit 4